MKPERIINCHGHLRHDGDIRDRIRQWEKWNVVRFCCLCMPPRCREHGYYTNEDFLAVKDEFSPMIVGLASVNINVDKIDEPQDIECYRNQGFVGLKFTGCCYPYNDERYFPLYEKAQELDMPIVFHMGWLAVDPAGSDRHYKINMENFRPSTLDRIARSFPRLKLIGAHLGHPEYPVAFKLMECFKNIHFDFTGGAGQKLHVRKVLSAMLPHPGLETDYKDPQENPALIWFNSLVFGTDNPEPKIWVPNSETIMDRLQIPNDLRKKFYFETAAEIFDWQNL